MAKPLVSVGVPVYQAKKYIGRALTSLIAQDYVSIELIVSDNSSTDGTWEIIQGFAAKTPKIRCIRQSSNIGIVANFVAVMNEARGSYFMWAAADDLWDPSFVSRLVAELESRPECGVAMSSVRRILERTGDIFDCVYYSGSNEPSKLSHFGLALEIARGKPYHLFIYGLFRMNLLRAAFDGLPKVVAGDRLFILKLSLVTKFVGVPTILHTRQMSIEPIARKYAGEELGRLWLRPFAGIRMIVAAGPYLFRSQLVPTARKMYIPILVLQLALTYLPLRFMESVRQLARQVRQKVRGEK